MRQTLRKIDEERVRSIRLHGNELSKPASIEHSSSESKASKSLMPPKSGKTDETQQVSAAWRRLSVAARDISTMNKAVS